MSKSLRTDLYWHGPLLDMPLQPHAWMRIHTDCFLVLNKYLLAASLYNTLENDDTLSVCGDVSEAMKYRLSFIGQ